MIGRIEKKDNVHNDGYIKGFDEIYYYFASEESFEKDDLVEFDYSLPTSENELPVANNIKKIKKTNH